MTAPPPATAAAAAHRQSHATLLGEVGNGQWRQLDAVIVPASRSADHVGTAAAIAAKAGSALLVLCGKDAQAAEASAIAMENAARRWYAVDMPSALTSELLAFPPLPSGLPELGGRASLSRKRNLGLLISRMVGWHTILFLDDDIRGIDASDVCPATGGLDSAAAVGFAVRDWPDNSVVCHANRLSGSDQDVFVGGSALLVNTRSDKLGHFSTIYNEDWLFLFDAVAERKVSRANTPVRQLQYDPFHDTRRGKEEEFGEVIAEGLMHYAHDPVRSTSPIHEGYWRGFLPRRRAFLTDVAQRLAALPPSPGRRTALNAVRAAQAQHATITASTCVRFVRHWRAERRVWMDRIARLDPAPSVAEALQRFGLRVVPPRPAPRKRATDAVTWCRSVENARALPRITVVGKPAHDSTTLAVLVPGFLDSGSGPGASSLAAALRRSGRTALSFDPRGTWRSPGQPAQIAPSVQLRDVVSVIGMVPPHERVVLIGHSLGAYLACLAAADDQRVTDVVAIMPPRCFVWPRDYDEERDTWRRAGERRFVVATPGSTIRWQFRVPHSVVADAVTHDLPATLAELRRPRILFVAGEHDQVIPVDAVLRLYEQCGSEDKSKVVLPVEHDYRDHPEQLRMVNQAVVDWLDATDRTPTRARAGSGTRSAGPGPGPAGGRG